MSIKNHIDLSKLNDIVIRMTDVNWDVVGKAIQTIEDNSHKFLGADKYTPILKNIYDGLGVPSHFYRQLSPSELSLGEYNAVYIR